MPRGKCAWPLPQRDASCRVSHALCEVLAEKAIFIKLLRSWRISSRNFHNCCLKAPASNMDDDFVFYFGRQNAFNINLGPKLNHVKENYKINLIWSVGVCHFKALLIHLGVFFRLFCPLSLLD